VLGNPVVLATLIVVPDPPVPKALSPNDPFNVVVCGFVTVPPHCDIP
tara:strand:+ start:119 stop:259 length:141 start_codon:yes stop_codon:yes gene_type:complete